MAFNNKMDLTIDDIDQATIFMNRRTDSITEIKLFLAEKPRPTAEYSPSKPPQNYQLLLGAIWEAKPQQRHVSDSIIKEMADIIRAKINSPQVSVRLTDTSKKRSNPALLFTKQTISATTPWLGTKDSPGLNRKKQQ